MNNPVIQAMLNRKSIRKYRDQEPDSETAASIVRAGQQAPFAAQLYSILLSRQKKQNPFGAPLLFTICVDMHRLELIMARRNWQVITNDLDILLLGIQDASLMAQNMVMAAESLGLGSCFLGRPYHRAERIAKEYKLPKRVFPLVQLVMGYPAENPPPRPRYPLKFVLFEGGYPRFSEETIKQAMQVMDEGYLAQGYYRNLDAMIPLKGARQETFSFENYGWTEHISRKWGQWFPSSKTLLEQLKKCGFDICESKRKKKVKASKA
jgi:nitroreductase